MRNLMKRQLIRIDEMLRLELFAQNNERPNIKADIEPHRRICVEYLELATVMPYNEILIAINEYDKSNPKMDELIFIKNLADKYKQSHENVIKRIQHVRRLEKHHRKG